MTYSIMISVLLMGVLIGVVGSFAFFFLLNRPLQKDRRKSDPLISGSQFEGRHLFSDSEANLSAKAVNAVLQFLFQELKDSGKVRRYFIRKLDEDIREAAKQKLLGAIVKKVEIRDFSLGQQSPEFTSISLNAAEADSTMALSYVEVGVHMKYSCGIWLSIAIDLVLDQSAQISVRLQKFEADAKLVFKREPFTHWYLSFCDDPEIDIDIETQLQARNFPQLTNLISNQLKKSIGRRHVWPSYSIRFRPFFDSSLIVKKSTAPTRSLRPPFNVLLVHIRTLDRLFTTKGNVPQRCSVGILLSKQPIQIVIEERQKKQGDRDFVVPKPIFTSVKFSDIILLGNTVTYVSEVTPYIESCPLREGLVLVAINNIAVSNAEHAKYLYEKGSASSNVTVTIKGTGRNRKRKKKDGSDIDIAAGDYLQNVSNLLQTDSIRRLRMTRAMNYHKFIEFDECFMLPACIDSYVNVCLLSVHPSSCSEKLKMLAFTSFTMSEIISDCDLTLRRECQFSRNLIRVLQNVNEDEELAKHRGYDRMQANGHITIRFQLLFGEDEQVKAFMDSQTSVNDAENNDCGQDSVCGVSVGYDTDKDYVMDPNDTSGHQLEARKLSVITYCSFCNGKIWLKNALECTKCRMVCHRKCAHLCYTSPCIPQPTTTTTTSTKRCLPNNAEKTLSKIPSTVSLPAQIGDMKRLPKSDAAVQINNSSFGSNRASTGSKNFDKILTSSDHHHQDSNVERQTKSLLAHQLIWAASDDKFTSIVQFTADQMMVNFLKENALSIQSTEYTSTEKLPIMRKLIEQLNELSLSISLESSNDELNEKEQIRRRTRLIQFSATEYVIARFKWMDDIRLVLAKTLTRLEALDEHRFVVVEPKSNSSIVQKVPPINQQAAASIGATYRRYKDKVISSFGKRSLGLTTTLGGVVSAVYSPKRQQQQHQRALTDYGASTIDENGGEKQCCTEQAKNDKPSIYDSITFRTHLVKR